MNKDSRSFFGKIKFNHISVGALFLIIFVLYQLVTCSAFSTNSSGGNLDTLAEDRVTKISIFKTESALHGLDIVNEARTRQVEEINNTGSFKIKLSNSMFSKLDSNLDWFPGAAEENPIKIISAQNIYYGLLNPLMLITPQISIDNTNASYSNLSEIMNFKKLTYDSGNNTAILTVSLNSEIIASSSKPDFLTANFNAYDAGFEVAQIDQERSTNIEVLAPTDKMVSNFSLFLPIPCNRDEKRSDSTALCNDILLMAGNSFKVKKLPATISYKLWKNDNKEEVPADFNFIIKLESTALLPTGN